jgi:hypothetical protein
MANETNGKDEVSSGIKSTSSAHLGRGEMEEK